jgi:hypothetical protein
MFEKIKYKPGVQSYLLAHPRAVIFILSKTSQV